MARKRKYFLISLAEFIPLFFIELLFSLLPMNFAYKVSEIIAKLVFFFDFKHRKRTIQHLIHAGITADLAKARILAKKNFIHFANVFVDTIKFKKVYNSKEKIIEAVKLEGNPDSIKKFLSPTAENAIVITAHYGNWEVAGIIYCAITGRKILTVMRKLDNPLMETRVIARRIGYGVQLIPKENSLRKLLKSLKNKESICIIADQHTSKSEGVEVKFFGQPARAHKSPVILHNKTLTPIFVAVCERIGHLKYKIKLKDPIIYDAKRSIEDTVQLYTSQIEELIRENPEQWCWTHRRWLNINR
ncbi:MAG TPA: lysophospholipid acyltransferase family protein [Victivallales bacterium]|nr:lysophospholipid acyltransferase family protein [Victivallales bacterium]HPO89974.1 lysophospholipid acyltransferase family protein [Victivallales bacterium]